MQEDAPHTPKGLKERLLNGIKQQWMVERTRKKILFFSVLSTIFLWLFWGIPLPTNLSSTKYPVSTKLFDRNGKLIYEIFANKRRTPIKISELPKYVTQATISIEDKDFYSHYGFSPTGVARSIYSIVFKGKVQGGSTLTQQLVKISLLSPERTIRRKIREFALSMVVETIYTKDQILEMYLNQIPYGSTAYGIEAASELYFNKQAKDLTLAEATFLAGLPAAPSKYSPFGAHPELAKERQETVLRRMVEDGHITSEEAAKTQDEELHLAQSETLKAPHFALWIKDQLADKYGLEVVEQGGLRVKTTLDLDLQDFAQDAVAKEVSKLTKLDVGNGATIVTRPASGEILAMVGSKDYFAQDEDGKVNILLAKRQPGSSIKPLNYALAIKDKKITASTVFADVPTCFSVAGQKAYCPRNYDGSHHGATQTRFALGNSYNIPAVRTLALNGINNFIDFASAMGITTFTDPVNYGLSLTLGGGEVKPMDMAVAYGTLANGGIKQPLLSILKVEDYNGKVLEETKLPDLDGDRVLPSEVSFIVSHILLDNNARSGAFGERSYLNVAGHNEVSVKTGTTNDRRDNWTIGYTAQIVVLTWVGNNDNSPMSGAVSGVSGASPIWNRIIKNALDKAEDGYYNKDDDNHAWPHQPDGVVGAKVCSTTGALPSGNETDPGCPLRFEYYLVGTVPSTTNGGIKDVQIDKTTGALAGKDTLPENTETQSKFVIYDPLGTAICLDCAAIASQSAVIRYPLLQGTKTQP